MNLETFLLPEFYRFIRKLNYDSVNEIPVGFISKIKTTFLSQTYIAEMIEAYNADFSDYSSGTNCDLETEIGRIITSEYGDNGAGSVRRKVRPIAIERLKQRCKGQTNSLPQPSIVSVGQGQLGEAVSESKADSSVTTENKKISTVAIVSIASGSILIIGLVIF